MRSFSGLIVYSSALLCGALTTTDSEWHCISDRKSGKLMHWSADRPNLLYTSSAKRHATLACSPTRINIVSNSMRFRCVDSFRRALVTLVSSVIALPSKWFHSWKRLFDRFSKSRLSVRGEIILWGTLGGKWEDKWAVFAPRQGNKKKDALVSIPKDFVNFEIIIRCMLIISIECILSK